MGWAFGTNAEGREVGYGVIATCDLPDCTVEIDRGLGYCCGGEHDGGEYGCGGYYCADHLGQHACTRDPLDREDEEIEASDATPNNV